MSAKADLLNGGAWFLIRPPVFGANLRQDTQRRIKRETIGLLSQKLGEGWLVISRGGRALNRWQRFIVAGGVAYARVKLPVLGGHRFSQKSRCLERAIRRVN